MGNAESQGANGFVIDEEWQMRAWNAARPLRRAKEKLRRARIAYDALAPNCPPEVRARAERRLTRAEKREFKEFVAYWSIDDPGRASPTPETAPAPTTGSSADNPIVID
jgi:hypothetical protein